MTTNAVWETLRWKTEAARKNDMGPKKRICFSVVGFSFNRMELVTIPTSVVR